MISKNWSVLSAKLEIDYDFDKSAAYGFLNLFSHKICTICNRMHRYITAIDMELPLLGIDLGYSATAKSCGVACSVEDDLHALNFGDCIQDVARRIRDNGPHILIIEAVLSTYHSPEGNPAIRGEFEKGRGWYHGPGVTTFAAALRFLSQLDQQLPKTIQLPLVEGFLSYKPTRTSHETDARRLIDEFAVAERFIPHDGSQPICMGISGIPEIRRYNAPTQQR